mmetsp:Transcript_45561/g.151024  ORF Transcript_45561/g.151024 Transcript_45561/m.151024 type:complete len:213 (+) Transcript_45561:1392-2030(+)
MPRGRRKKLNKNKRKAEGKPMAKGGMHSPPNFGQQPRPTHLPKERMRATKPKENDVMTPEIMPSSRRGERLERRGLADRDRGTRATCSGDLDGLGARRRAAADRVHEDGLAALLALPHEADKREQEDGGGGDADDHADGPHREDLLLRLFGCDRRLVLGLLGGARRRPAFGRPAREAARLVRHHPVACEPRRWSTKPLSESNVSPIATYLPW